MKPGRPDRSRRFAEASYGPILPVLLSCVAIAMFLTTLGSGFANLTATSVVPAAPHPRASAPRPSPTPPSVANSAVAIEKERQEKKDFELKLAKAEERAHQLGEEKSKLALDRQAVEKSQAALGELQRHLQDLARVAAEKSKSLTQPEIERERSLAGANARLIEARRLFEDADRNARELRREIQERKTMFDPQVGATAGDGNPQWVECVRGAVILVPQGERIPAERLKNAPSFTKAVSGRYVVFLVRPTGMDSFASARKAAEESGASRLGYEPIDPSWQIKYR